ncbi:GntR family transcriptional regulator [Agathobaculum sp. NTUH-O15-33]|uniref:GntR family transcriptional regulator n=1 Tax=Agathobaculum sp. NTUH-O15-33 TaxID=3079302 RepID=UPI0029589A08|nr:GntR family transcriptional regulator [Agathobaculum sp. NTUH-O15-33]WNX86105.1 GntR family transcriptional regulator [Agathobaculum sp. NTUH-O15-33]
MKHQCIEEDIRGLILSGDGVAADGQLCSERDLAARFRVSRSAVRKAIDSLCSQGWLIRFHGRGTYVKNMKDFHCSQSLYSVTRCAQHYEELGMQPLVTVLEQAVVPANQTIASYLKIAEGDPVLKLQKLYQANRLILNLSVSYLSPADFPGIENQDFSIPICEVLRARYGAYPRKTENTIEAVLPSAEIAKNLKITETTPILLFESLTTGIMNGRYLPLEYYKTYHRTDHLRFRFDQEHEAVD